MQIAGQHALGYKPTSYRIIPNGFDLERFRPDPIARQMVRNELHIPHHAPVVGLIARFDPQKNHLGFLQAARYVAEQMPEVHFILAGRNVDPQNPQLSLAVSSLNLANRVHLLGQRHDVPRLMAALDVLALSSSYGEAFPSVLGEAMACGAPCVVTDVGDSALIVGDTGRVTPPGDMRALAQALVEVLTMPEEERSALGMRARERIAQRFEISKVVAEYERLYEELYERIQGSK